MPLFWCVFKSWARLGSRSRAVFCLREERLLVRVKRDPMSIYIRSKIYECLNEPRRFVQRTHTHSAVDGKVGDAGRPESFYRLSTRRTTLSEMYDVQTFHRPRFETAIANESIQFVWPSRLDKSSRPATVRYRGSADVVVVDVAFCATQLTSVVCRLDDECIF